MKVKKGLIEVMNIVLILFFFYEGIYKIAHWSEFSFWFHNMPLTKPIWVPLVYAIPIAEIGIAVALVLPKTQLTALMIAIACLFIFVLWVVIGRFTSIQLTMPYHALWKHPTWFQKMLLALIMAWFAFLIIFLRRYKPVTKTSCANLPVNAQ